MTGWAVERRRGSASAFHGRELPTPSARTVWVLQVDRPALVLGSTQPASVVDSDAATAAGAEVVRRRSGGGAVLLDPDDTVWIDLLLPPTDPRWSDDVGVAFHWLGQVWADALSDLGIGAQVHRGGLCVTQWSRLVCFGGLGPGEVITTDGRKVVGLAQRRGRFGAWFQMAVPLRWDPDRLTGLLALTPLERQQAADALIPVVAPVQATAHQVVEAFLARLPA